MPTPGRKRARKPDRRRLLKRIADCGPDGKPEAIMQAHGFTIADMVELVRSGLASARAERIVAGSRKFEVATVRITAAVRGIREGWNREKIIIT
jgi:hypothetical protein